MKKELRLFFSIVHRILEMRTPHLVQDQDIYTTTSHSSTPMNKFAPEMLTFPIYTYMLL